MRERATGNCYEANALMILGMGFDDDDAASGIKAMKEIGLEDAVLVHGMVERHTDGLRHGHAWVEGHSTVMGASMVVAHSNGLRHEIPAHVYYDLGKVSDAKRYTRDEARSALLAAGTYGPWD